MRCEEKRRYLTRAAAEMALANALRDGGGRFTKKKDVRRRLGVYHCRHCGFWHLGKRPDHDYPPLVEIEAMRLQAMREGA